MSREILSRFKLDESLTRILEKAPSIIIPEKRADLLDLAMGGEKQVFSVSYQIDGIGTVEEATVTHCKNGLSVNYPEAYMRRRDPNCMLIGDDLPTDKTTYKERYGESFEKVRQETFDWLAGEDLIVLPFISGDPKHGGYESVLVGPKNAAFFTGGLADLQGFIPASEIRDGYEPKAVIYLAPTFRHTHFDGKQVVVHNRLENMHEVHAFNLYPGPSAKKGVYGILLTMGEREDWITAHASTVRVTTPYDNAVVIMHEGASGGGKSEMIEEVHRQPDGSVLLAKSEFSEDSFHIELGDTCELHPVTDDMALCHPSYQNNKKLVVTDAESGWFLRFDHVKKYGASVEHERLTIHPPEPLIFFNMDSTPDSTILIWEHIMDEPGKPCPNPRVIMPRHFIPEIISEPIEIDVRSFGVRMPPCTRENPTYGIAGMLHVLPPALAWLWRLVAPRGHGNPSIVDTGGMKSEGVGSYWPFATGKMVKQANLLLEQIRNTPDTRYVLIPNQHIGAYTVAFTAEWLDREYLARKGGAKFRADQLEESRCSTLGYSVKKLRIDGHDIPKGLLRTHKQLEVGKEAYDTGAEILEGFFKKELKKFQKDTLDPLGQKIIDAYMRDASVAELDALLPMNR